MSRHVRVRLFLLLAIGLIIVGAAGAGCSSTDALPTLPAPAGPALIMLYTDN